MIEYSSKIVGPNFWGVGGSDATAAFGAVGEGRGVRDGSGAAARDVAGGGVEAFDRLEKAGLVKRRRKGRVHWLALEAKPMQEAQAWIDRYRKFWEGNLDQFEKIWTNYKRRKPNKMMMNNEVQKPDERR